MAGAGPWRSVWPWKVLVSGDAFSFLRQIVQKDLDFLAVRKTWNITGFCRDPFIAQVQRDIDLLKRQPLAS